MNLSQLEVLVAIVETGSLTDAAEVVGLTQSAVSHSLSRLETELGVTLLERSRQGIVVTTIGEDVLQHARTILTQSEIIRQKTNRERGLSVGKVRMGIVPYVAPRLLTGILRDFQHQYPDIEVVLFEGDPQELLEWLSTDVVDIATVPIPEQFPYTMPFVSAQLKAVLPTDHPLANQETISIEALKQYPLIGPRSQFRVFETLLKPYNLTAPRFRYQVSAYNTIITMVREKMGLSLMPDMVFATDTDDLVLRPLEPMVNLDIHLATFTQSPANLAFMKNAHRWAKENGYLSPE